jgi:hypothetical protein
MKGVSIKLLKTWTPDDGSEFIEETIHDSYEEALEVWETADLNIYYVSIWTCNDIGYNRRMIYTNQGT